MNETGYIRDTEDPRDHLFGLLELAEDLPDYVELWRPGMKVKRQRENSCTGRALSYALQMAHKTPSEFSAFDAYFKGRYAMGGVVPTDDAGCQLRPLFNAVQKFGCALEVFSPSNDPAAVNKAPTWAAQKSAHTWRGLRSYRKIVSPDEARQALAKGHPVLGGWMVDTHFRAWTSGTYKKPSEKQPLLGGHAMCLSGYSGNVFHLVNSWGTSWADRGFVKVDDEFVSASVGLWAVDVSL